MFVVKILVNISIIANYKYFLYNFVAQKGSIGVVFLNLVINKKQRVKI